MNRLTSSFIAIAVVACALPAFAQRRGGDEAKPEAKVSGSYAVAFEVVANNCKDARIKLDRETLVVSQKGRAVSIAIEGVPEMKGQLGRRGKLRADAPRSRGGDADSSYGISGRIASGKLHMVFIAEYFRGDKPLCTQSFSVTGRRN